MAMVTWKVKMLFPSYVLKSMVVFTIRPRHSIFLFPKLHVSFTSYELEKWKMEIVTIDLTFRWG